MSKATLFACCLTVVSLLGLTGCGGNPSFSLAWSEYPSWSVFGVAHEKGLINGEKGKLGKIEEKWGVDIVLKEAEYDPCITMYNTQSVDAVCMTNMDSLNPALSQKSVAILPTSTSIGADACIVVGIDSVEDLRQHKVYGLAKSVSEYCFVRNLELKNEKEEDHQFTNMDPGAAALAMQTGSAEHKAIMVWNPFVLQTLKSVKESKRLFDSKTIPEEIIDMVVVSQETLNKSGGKEFACAVIDTFYEVNRLLKDPNEGDDTLVSLGKKFSNLGLEEMKQVVQETQFYKTPDEALGLFTGDKFPKTMERIVDFCVSHKIVDAKPQVAFGSKDSAGNAQLRFDPTYIKLVAEKQ